MDDVAAARSSPAIAELSDDGWIWTMVFEDLTVYHLYITYVSPYIKLKFERDRWSSEEAMVFPNHYTMDFRHP